MTDRVIKVEALSKQYRLGQVGRKSLSHDINRWWHTVRGKEDPYLKIGETNDRSIKGSSEYVWALRDINFEVKQGDVLGVIGRNGAGKSTLLKILSKVTAPTTGTVHIKGRIASLLEVGTGFHPDLSGRDNVFLNGAILGMTKKEVAAKFDAIVDFAGVERYIDTPVKRYSSGMYVRLAFAVAAHLEPDILIVDEVLAVGDAEFQKKCLGRMKDVSGEGRTVLFVSHNMTAVQTICSNAMLLENGFVSAHGRTTDIVDIYLKKVIKNNLSQEWSMQEAPGNELVKIKSIKARPLNEKQDRITLETAIDIEFEFWNFIPGLTFNLSMHVFNSSDQMVFASRSLDYTVNNGLLKLNCNIPGNFLNDGGYYVSMMIVQNSNALYYLQEAISFEVVEEQRNISWLQKWPGYVRPKLEWSITM